MRLLVTVAVGVSLVLAALPFPSHCAGLVQARDMDTERPHPRPQGIPGSRSKLIGTRQPQPRRSMQVPSSSPLALASLGDSVSYLSSLSPPGATARQTRRIRSATALKESACGLKTLSVSSELIGHVLGVKIIFPRTFKINFCSGTCERDAVREQFAKNRAGDDLHYSEAYHQILHYSVEMNSRSQLSHGSPFRCVPSGFQSASTSIMSVVTQHGTTVIRPYRHHLNISASGCECTPG